MVKGLDELLKEIKSDCGYYNTGKVIQKISEGVGYLNMKKVELKLVQYSDISCNVACVTGPCAQCSPC